MTNLNKIAYVFALSCSFIFAACSDDKEHTIDKSNIQQVEDFTDPRDNKIYRCVQIGNQIWMIDNLAYFLENGAADGCYTWEQPSLDLENFVLGKQEFQKVYMSVVQDPNHNWQQEVGVPAFTLQMQLNFYLNGTYTQEKFLSNMSYYKAFYDVLIERMEQFKEEYIPTLAVKEHDEYEKLNRNYSQTYGYLYSLKGARKAVPEGWRLPTDKDWQQLEITLGMPAHELEAMDAWRGEGCGNFLKIGGEALFEAKMAGCNAYSGSGVQWIRLQESAYFWTDEERTIEQNVGSSSGSGSSDSETETGKGDDSSLQVVSEGVIRQLSLYSSKIWRGTTRLNNSTRDVVYSVRCVKDAQ